MITMRGWMFIKEYESLRSFIAKEKSVFAIADLHYGAFPELKDVSVTMPILMNASDPNIAGYFIRPVKSDLIVRNLTQIDRNIAGLISPHEIFVHHLDDFKVVEGQPFVYWWDDDLLKRYGETPKLEEESDVKTGMQTSNNTCFIRFPWEVNISNILLKKIDDSLDSSVNVQWVPYIKGAKGIKWFEPVSYILLWGNNGLFVKTYADHIPTSFIARIYNNDKFYFKPGIAYSTIGSNFSARIRRYQSIFDISGASVFPENLINTTCLMNSKLAREVLSALNPTINFQTSDVKRLPLFPIESANQIFDRLDRAFTEHEAARETSVEFRQPAPSPWNYAQEWAQQAVDRPAGKPLPEYAPVYDNPLPTDYVSYAIGVALGRFEPSSPNPFSPREKGDNSSNSPLLRGEGLGVRSRGAGGEVILTNSILYLSTYSEQDSLEHPASQIIKEAWDKHGEKIAANKPLRKWLRESFFKDVHVKMYEKRPIYFPLSSEKKNFVAFVNIHRWTDNTLQTLLAEHLKPELTKLEGELKDLREAQASGNRGNQNRYATVQKLGEELQTFINLVAQCAERGAPQHKPQDTAREADARFQMNLDDGVMVNSAALWTLLEPQWKDPKKWWSELCNAKGKKDYDWSHLAARYFPQRVDAKCQKDPSLAVAHGCFWQYHPEKAYQWELRLQDEIAENFTIDEVNSDGLRQDFEQKYSDKIEELKTKEKQRRQRNQNRANSGED